MHDGCRPNASAGSPRRVARAGLIDQLRNCCALCGRDSHENDEEFESRMRYQLQAKHVSRKALFVCCSVETRFERDSATTSDNLWGHRFPHSLSSTREPDPGSGPFEREMVDCFSQISEFVISVCSVLSL